MHFENGLWQDTLELYPGRYEYKFIVDGIWRHDPHVTIEDDGTGNINNILTIGTSGVPAAGRTSAPPQKEQPVKPQIKPDIKKEIPPQSKNTQQKPITDYKPKPPSTDHKPKPDIKPPTQTDQASSKKDQSTQLKKGQSKEQPQTVKSEKKKEEDPARLVGHWEKVQINTVTGKESWWLYVKTADDSSKFPLRRRIPPDCVNCNSKVLVEDDVFARYGVEWQPLCVKCYANGRDVPLITGKVKPTSKTICHWCLESENVIGETCKDCSDYIVSLQTNFGLSTNEAFTNLYYYQSNLRKSKVKAKK